MSKQVYLTDFDKLVPRVGRSVTINGEKIAIFLLTDGTVHAVEDNCPITNWPILEGTVAEHYVYEPMRDYKISLLDGKIQEPDEGQIKVYPIEISDGKIYTTI
ncbi:nitrite reductase (NADH) small subunit [Enterococcus sp. PF1-24]|uniref:nitrite reductase (NAD(P)H) small subunit n=1 Tax=unclassified Enterococcus TaxID=2608891 RepID=UPI00247467DD|nr:MULTISPECIES: nitrite reductase (NAD(P)H) small subunit [unclassified Enterococcus]MDH6363225.1 nitrite reductase (NADH) small subunit [Enterococcus sp. PFB1-1]MDH6400474.1 nitrite reductase (NADH) small subunit [Enterococcus sp. PF1-24]